MKGPFLAGLAGALATGLLIGLQTTLSSRSGRLVGSALTALYTNLAGGVLALLVLAGLALSQGWGTVLVPRVAGVYLTLAGALGLLIIAGIAFSYGRIGVTAGTAAVILGQLTVAAAVDTLGLAGGAPIPLSFRRLAGLAVMALAVALLLPQPGRE